MISMLSTRIICLFFIFIIALHSFELNPDSRSWIGCISHHEATHLLQLYKNKPLQVEASIDLGYSMKRLMLNNAGIRLSRSNNDVNAALIATWDEVQHIIKKKPSGCYALYDDGSKPFKISTISSKTNIPASLCPPLERSGAPTMILGGFTMHRISGDAVDPINDTNAKLASINIHSGDHVLDTCLGLGYTAIGAAKMVGKQGSVVSIEYDDAAIEMCSYNPWSQSLFDSSLPIEIREGDACEIVKHMDTKSYDAIIHDPPALALCRTDLYGLEFYSNIRRILRKSGHLFHYIGNPSSRESGRLYAGITDRLLKAGFKTVQKVDSAFGVRAYD